MLPKPIDLTKCIVMFVLCIFYTAWVALGILVAYIFKKNSKFWVVKERPDEPAQLRNEEYGKHKFAHVNGIKIHYVEKGDPKNKLVVLVHGFPEFWYSWRYQLKELGKDYWTIAIDQRGYGESDKPKSISDYHINKMSDDINALVKSLGRDKFILIGHDWGAVVGFNYVFRYMDTLEKYIMIGGPPSAALIKLITTSPKQFLMSWYIFFFQFPLVPEFVIGFYDLKVFDTMKIGDKEDVECFKYTFSKPNALTGPINYYRAARVLYPDAPLQRPKKCAPGLFLLGEHDKYISRETGNLAKAEIDNLDFKLIPGANHFAQQHKPDQTNLMIREFLEKK